MYVIQTVASLKRAHGGPSRSIPALCEALSANHDRLHLITSSDTCGDNILPRPPVCVHTQFSERRFTQILLAQRFKATINRIVVEEGDDRRKAKLGILHDHGLWLATNHATAVACKRLGIKRIVSPRGMLSDWALKRRRLVKAFLWQIFQRRDLACADAFHATSELERDEIRKLGFKQPVLVVPNGIEVPSPLPRRNRQDRKQVLFLSRIHPVKGVLELVTAFHHANLTNEWELVIAGPSEGNHEAAVKALVSSLSLSARVKFIGDVDDNMKWQLYADADLFVLPSFSENFGIAIAEALASRLPVITTTRTPWKILGEKGFGWWIEPNVDELTASIRVATSLSTEERQRMGRAASEYVKTQFTWNEIGQQTRQFYTQILGSNSI